MAENYISSMEKGSPESEKVSLLSRRDGAPGRLFTSTPSLGRRSAGVERCTYGTTAFCSVAFVVLGACILSLGIVKSQSHTSVYIAGGGAELVLGICLMLRLTLQCLKCARSKESGDTVLFVSLTLLFLLWCAVVCSYCVALVLSGLSYDGDKLELAAIVLSCVSLLLTFVFGGSVCFWAGCPAD